jgi:mono/diheme cytochrome c family protein
MKMHRLSAKWLLLAVLLGGGCRGMTSERPPIHPNLNMVFQERFNPQERNPFFADNRSMRPPVPGTIARGLLREDAAFFLGRTADGAYVAEMPVPITRALLERGRERYDVFCAVCHGLAGDGLGIIMTGTSQITGRGYGYVPVPSFHDDRLRQEADGYMYDVLTNGVRNMPPYGHQIPIADRWAIVAYIRALQRSQQASPNDVPEGVRARIQAAAPVDPVAPADPADATAPTDPPAMPAEQQP